MRPHLEMNRRRVGRGSFDGSGAAVAVVVAGASAATDGASAGAGGASVSAVDADGSRALPFAPFFLPFVPSFFSSPAMTGRTLIRARSIGKGRRGVARDPDDADGGEEAHRHERREHGAVAPEREERARD